jgi:hypothetical protein
MIRSARKETPVRDLPRFHIDPLVLADRQGFDDGYFGNGFTQDQTESYRSGYIDGQMQRERADKAEALEKRKAKDKNA